MRLSGFIRDHADQIISRWSEKVVDRLRLSPDARPQLVNDMPEVLSDLVEALDAPPEEWPSSSARAHARQRIALGMDIGGLSEELGMIGESIVELAGELGADLHAKELAHLLRMLARSTAQSVTEYARLRDRELSKESARHFSFIAHELRTPLQSASLATEVLAETHPSPTIERIQRAHAQLTSLIDNSLVDARLTSEPLVRKEAISGRELASLAAQNGAVLAEQRQIRLDIEADDFQIEVDRRLIVSALTNLTINGIKFSKPGSHVTLSARVEEDRAHFEIEDACGGLPEEAVPRLFEPFVQAGRDRSGFGLGLMIVKQAAEAHGGSVRVVNHEGSGCSFILELPRRSD